MTLKGIDHWVLAVIYPGRTKVALLNSADLPQKTTETKNVTQYIILLMCFPYCLLLFLLLCVCARKGRSQGFQCQSELFVNIIFLLNTES